MKQFQTVCVLASESELRCLRRRIDGAHVQAGIGKECLSGSMRGRDVCIVRTGVGRRHASSAARVICRDLRPGLVIIAGAAGALDSCLQPGTVIVVEEVVREGTQEVIACPADVSRRAVAALRAAGVKAGTGRCCQARSFVHRASHKQALGAETGAHVVDMESFALAAELRNAGVPFVDIRVVSDTARRDIVDMETLVRLRFRRGRRVAALHLLRNPRELLRACVLYRGMAGAAAGIADAVCALMDADITDCRPILPGGG